MILFYLTFFDCAGIQLWHHGEYDKYKCLGPYVATWGCCSSSWHPSLLGHELRASHYTFYWLLAYKEALGSILLHMKGDETGSNTASTLLTATVKHEHHERKHTQAEAIHKSPYVDDMQCLTAYHPLANKGADLESAVVNNNVDKAVFQKEVFENFLDKNIIIGAMNAGYKDFKYMYYGNSESKPLSLKLHIKKVGIVTICQPPGVWGKLPDKFKSLWDSSVKFYLTSDIKNYDTLENVYLNGTVIHEASIGSTNIFDFKVESSKEFQFSNDDPSNTQSICGHFKESIPIGFHVLTLVPTTTDNIMVSTVLVP